MEEVKSMTPLAILAQLRLQTAKASKGMSLSVRNSMQLAGDDDRWEGVVPSGIPGQDQCLLKQHEFSSEEAGMLRKQIENLTVRPASAPRQKCSPARPNTAYAQSKKISMNVLDPNEWERIGRQISTGPRPKSARHSSTDKVKTSQPSNKGDDRKGLRRKIRDAQGMEHEDNEDGTISTKGTTLLHAIELNGANRCSLKCRAEAIQKLSDCRFAPLRGARPRIRRRRLRLCGRLQRHAPCPAITG
jgi:hypothetical protein